MPITGSLCISTVSRLVQQGPTSWFYPVFFAPACFVVFEPPVHSHQTLYVVLTSKLVTTCGVCNSYMSNHITQMQTSIVLLLRVS